MYTRGTYIPQPDVLRVHTRVKMYHFSCLHFSVNCIKYWVSLTYRQRVYATLTLFHFVFYSIGVGITNKRDSSF